MPIFKKVYITKYALTQGIHMKSVEIDMKNHEMVKDVMSSIPNYYHKLEWHYTLEEATAKAEEMRLKKIASLTRQIEKLRRMKFKYD